MTLLSRSRTNFSGPWDEIATQASKYIGESPALTTKISGSQKNNELNNFILNAAIYYSGANIKQDVLKRRFHVGHHGECSLGVCLTVGIGHLLFKVLEGIGAIEVDICTYNVDNGASHQEIRENMIKRCMTHDINIPQYNPLQWGVIQIGFWDVIVGWWLCLGSSQLGVVTI